MRTLLPSLLLLLACGPAKARLSELRAVSLSAVRDSDGPVTVTLGWDTNVTPCGPIEGLRGLLDGAAVSTQNGEFVANRLDDSGVCRAPSMTLTPPSIAGPRVLAFEDQEGRAISMTVTTLEAASVRPEGAKATATPGERLTWTVFAPPEGLASWKIEYGVPNTLQTTWAEGQGPVGNSLSVQVPAGTPAGMGREVAVSWRVNAVVSSCDGAQSCRVELAGRHAYPLEVSP